MDKAIARHIVTEAFKSQKPLSDLVPFLKEQCAEEDYKSYAIAIAKAIHTINVELTNKIFAFFPELEAELEEELRRYGRFL